MLDCETYYKQRYLEEMQKNVADRKLMSTGVNNFLSKHPWHNEKEVLEKIKTDPLFAEMFVINPETQNCYERFAEDYINMTDNLSCVHLPVGGPNALYVYQGKVVSQDSIPVELRKSIKSIDFKIQVFGKRNLTIYASHKHTDIAGGSQNHQFDDLQVFSENSSKGDNLKIKFIALCDGNYYQSQKIKISDREYSRLEALNVLYKNDSFEAMTTTDFVKKYGENSNKIINGQFFTKTNPFELKPFEDWFDNIPEDTGKKDFLEPFAGENNLPKMIRELGINNNWKCYDIDPPEKNNFPESPVIQQDTLKNYPSGFPVVITNPPYLAKVSASTKHIPFPETDYDDLYKVCLDKMLSNSDYIAAIIPETFIVSGEFTDRLDTVISLTCKMFDDTDCPVCLALFNKNKTKDFKIYQMDKFLGYYKDLKNFIPRPHNNYVWKINDPSGIIGIKCVDGTYCPGIQFIHGDQIKSDKIKISSRAETRVSGLPEEVNLDEFLDKCNIILDKYREDTKDVFLASFKGLRKDGCYRRRLDFNTAKLIMSKALEEIKGNKNTEIDLFSF